MNQDLQRRLDRIAEVLQAGAVANPAEQIAHLIFLKLVDEQETRRESEEGAGQTRGASLFPLQAERFRWNNWRARRGEDLHRFLGDEVFYYMGSLSNEAPVVARHFRGSSLGISDPGVLERLVDELGGVDFGQLDAEVRGGVFEYLLDRLGPPPGRDDEVARKRPARGPNGRPLGTFRTPPRIRALMVRMTDPNPGDSVYDPACGTGGFLVDAADCIRARDRGTQPDVAVHGDDHPRDRRHQTVDVAIHGTDVSPNLVRIATINLLLHGVPDPKLQSANALSGPDAFTEAALERRYDVVLSNPPLLPEPPRGPVRRDLPTTGRRGELLFLALAMQSLASGGRCAVLMPDSGLSGGTRAHLKLREALLRRFDLQAVVSLPTGVFGAGARVRTSIVVFRRPPDEPRDDGPVTRHVWFYDLRNDGFGKQETRAGGGDETADKSDIPTLLKAWAAYEGSGFKAPPGLEGGSFIEAGSNRPRSWWAPFETVAEAEFDLAGSRYGPFVDEATPEEDPAGLVREILDLEREITAGFGSLLDDLNGPP